MSPGDDLGTAAVAPAMVDEAEQVAVLDHPQICGNRGPQHGRDPPRIVVHGGEITVPKIRYIEARRLGEGHGRGEQTPTDGKEQSLADDSANDRTHGIRR